MDNQTPVRDNKHITDLHHLEQYGINLLTGESDAYCMRLLCDLNEDGVALVRTYFGMPKHVEVKSQFNENWNSQVNGKPAIASILLAHEILWEIAKFALLHVDGYDYVVKNYGLTGGDKGNRLIQHYHARMNEYYALDDAEREKQGPLPFNIFINCAKTATGPRVGDRMVHAMSGRAA
jgi:hypothetical protein